MNLYLLKNSLSGRYYIGVTNNIVDRLNYHNGPNSHYTGKQKGEWKLIGVKYFIVDSMQEKKRSD